MAGIPSGCRRTLQQPVVFAPLKPPANELSTPLGYLALNPFGVPGFKLQWGIELIVITTFVVR